jgi:hypothetical protein
LRLAQDLKEAQQNLAPSPELKAMLLEKMRPTPRLAHLRYAASGIAATLLIAVFIFLFFNKNNDNQLVINKAIIRNEEKEISSVADSDKKTRNQQAPRIKKGKPQKQQQSDLVDVFKAHSTNLAWQSDEDEEADLPSPSLSRLQCDE